MIPPVLMAVANQIVGFKTQDIKTACKQRHTTKLQFQIGSRLISLVLASSVSVMAFTGGCFWLRCILTCRLDHFLGILTHAQMTKDKCSRIV